MFAANSKQKMISNMKTGIIIPCYNEADRINQIAFLHFIKQHSEYHLCFVNDGSKDETIKVLNRLKRNANDRISVVDVKRNGGKAAAVRAGARYLYTREDIEYIGFMDADLSTDFDDFKALVDKLKSDDKLVSVFGSRNLGNGDIQRKGDRGVLSKIVGFCIKMILGLPITDTQCGAKVFRKEIIPIIYGKPFVSRWLFDVEIFIRLKKHFGSKRVMNHIHEQALMRWIHEEGSKLDLKASLQIPARLASIWLTYTNFQLVDDSQVVQFMNMSLNSSYEELSIAA